ncbi:EPIDERMAL PATTERNING FACTOR-like protein 1 [Canna indica]|uniref:Epidermal patterning factor-like protein n=1 Tax=Canna indica TaxID=4628 RepID=A0AAQ3PXD4_9LILI|nr:EPIDERMAL PATTERNING FACTOR-like protein 1 [Canna indica]
MSSTPSHDILLTVSFLFTLLNLLLPASSSLDDSLLSSSEGMLVEDKARLGSAPPNCHNRCNKCTPCSAVQDPTSPAQPKLQVPPMDDSFPEDKLYSNYKPLGWKCCCGNRLYNP